MKKERKRICVDMDEVIADAAGENLKRYNERFNECLTSADLEGRSFWDVVAPNRHDALIEFLDADDFFAVLDVMPDAQRVLKAMRTEYEVFIATAAMEVPRSFVAKFEWMKAHFPFIQPSNIVYCGDKSILNADYLIDDNPRQLRRFRGQGILFHAHHNVGVRDWPRVNSWLDVEKMFLKK